MKNSSVALEGVCLAHPANTRAILKNTVSNATNFNFFS
ncbi:hypothetical protein J2Z43_000212 [Clostridioides mangenotii]|uniref:Uncharacterized protein n=1 Tax=Metaclostridioides mangenotii TaxID=1540 RepID=A0ABS4E7A9_9FIRM|nr:hypothetical protein [Clostridioides mangenotii]